MLFENVKHLIHWLSMQVKRGLKTWWAWRISLSGIHSYPGSLLIMILEFKNDDATTIVAMATQMSTTVTMTKMTDLSICIYMCIYIRNKEKSKNGALVNPPLVLHRFVSMHLVLRHPFKFMGDVLELERCAQFIWIYTHTVLYGYHGNERVWCIDFSQGYICLT